MATSTISPVEALATESSTPIDINRYATKKTVAQGMLDIALLTSNASQLKYILQVGEKQPFYMLLVFLISTSIILQIGMGVVMLTFNLLRDCRLHLLAYKRSANIINAIVLGGCFLITALNIIISSFDPGLAQLSPICVGALFLIIGSLDLNKKKDRKPANVLNDLILLLIFLVTSINVVITGFGFGRQPSSTVTTTASTYIGTTLNS